MRKLTHEYLDEVDVATEAFGLLIAGSHTTYSSLVMLFKHIFDRSDVRSHVYQELDKNLPFTPVGVYPYPGLESKLPYLSATMKESFRLTLVFRLPLPRVIPAGGQPMAGQHIPGGTVVSSINYCIGHNPHIWGRDVEEFKLDRWVKGERADQNMLMAFGAGHRACIGRNMAMMSMWKVSATLLRNYEFTPATGTTDGKIEMRGLTCTVKSRARDVEAETDVNWGLYLSESNIQFACCTNPSWLVKLNIV